MSSALSWMTELWLPEWPVLGVTAQASGTKSALRKRRINPDVRIFGLFMNGTPGKTKLFSVDVAIVLLIRYRDK